MIKSYSTKSKKHINTVGITAYTYALAFGTWKPEDKELGLTDTKETLSQKTKSV